LVLKESKFWIMVKNKEVSVANDKIERREREEKRKRESKSQQEHQVCLTIGSNLHPTVNVIFIIRFF